MKMSILDKSNCFRGLLLLIGKDMMISGRERETLLQVGKRLDFEKKFCENAIGDLLENKYLDKTPPTFSHRVIAEAFLLVGVRLALSDNYLHAAERTWLKSIAEANGLGAEWLDGEIEASRKEKQIAGVSIHELDPFL